MMVYRRCNKSVVTGQNELAAGGDVLVSLSLSFFFAIGVPVWFLYMCLAAATLVYLSPLFSESRLLTHLACYAWVHGN